MMNNYKKLNKKIIHLVTQHNIANGEMSHSTKVKRKYRTKK